MNPRKKEDTRAVMKAMLVALCIVSIHFLAISFVVATLETSPVESGGAAGQVPEMQVQDLPSTLSPGLAG